MLLKLFKYDFKASARFGVPLLIAIAAMTVLGCISTAVTVGNAGAESFETATNAPFEEMLIFFGMGGLVLISFALAGAAAVMSVLLVVQFYRSTVSDEAYLTFTLPVTSAQILWSKLFNTVVWSLFAGLALFLAGAAILGTGITMAGVAEDFVNTFGELFAFLHSMIGQSGLTVFLCCILGAAAFVSSYLMVFMAITFGSVIVRKHKALAAVAMIFVINFITSGITSVMQFVLLGDFTIKSVMYDGMFALNNFLVSSIVLYAATAVIYFLVTRYMMEKKLNLD
ncbi:MAG: hypothetical protein E7579_07710 [Ruminococcaceae bacterium]|nr:hypothetical protein [Oscillospiraceae bacterium]